MKSSLWFVLGGVALIGLIAGGWYFFSGEHSFEAARKSGYQTADREYAELLDDAQGGDEASGTDAPEERMSIIGPSMESREIVAYHFGAGNKELLFIGGIHGGYSWNTAAVAYALIDYLEANPERIPAGLRVTVVPVLNPDGLASIVNDEDGLNMGAVDATEEERIAARFNSRNVDLNRNFDCQWQAVGQWQSREVSGGEAPFSEPEAQAIKTYVETRKPIAVVVWYAAAGGVFASSCNNGVSEETRTLTNLYAEASGYAPHQEFDFYEITGDMVNWFAKENIPAVSVLLSTHEVVEWEKNKAGIEAMFDYYGE